MCNLLDNFVYDPMRVTVSEKGLSVKESPFSFLSLSTYRFKFYPPSADKTFYWLTR